MLLTNGQYVKRAPTFAYADVVPDEIDEFFGESNDDVAAIARAARRLVLDVLPDAREMLDRPDGLVAYATGPRPMKDFWAAVVPHTRYVNLQLANGALVEDPAGIVEGTGKRIRHVKLHTVDDVDRPILRSLLDVSLATHRTDTI